MAMDDILKLLVESRQQGQPQHSSQGSDPMTELIGGLLGGGQSSGGGQGEALVGVLGSLLGGGQTPSSGTNQSSDAIGGILGSLLGGGQSSAGGQQSGLGGIMSLLEMVTGTSQQSGLGQSAMSNSPIMGLIQPLVEPLAKKLKISPELAMIVVSFVLQKMLAHHPTSGRDSNQFNLDDLLGQVGSGKLDPNMLQSSGMVEELAKVTGMDKGTAAKSLNTAFTLVGQRALQAASAPSPSPAAAQKNLGSSGRKRVD